MVDPSVGRNTERDQLLALTLFHTGPQVSEALDITPPDIGNHDGHPVTHVRGERCQTPYGCVSRSLAYRLKSHAYTKRPGLDDKIFRFNRKRAWQIVKKTAEDSGIERGFGRTCSAAATSSRGCGKRERPGLFKFVSLDDHEVIYLP